MLPEILLTALATAALTVAAVAAVLPPLMRRRVSRWAAAFNDEVGPHIEERVRAGVIAAIESDDVSARLDEAGTDLEARVRKGIIEALSGAAIRESTRTVTQAGATIVEGGLQALLAGLGAPPTRPPKEEPGDET